MKSFGWIVFLAFLVILSCAVAGSLTEGLPQDECYRIQTKRNKDCPQRCRVGSTKIKNPDCPNGVCPNGKLPFLCGKLQS